MWNKKNDKNELIYKTETDSNIEYKFMNTQREISSKTSGDSLLKNQFQLELNCNA